MGEQTVFECDVTGERFGARNDVWEVPIRRRWSSSPFEVHEYDVHFCDEALEDSDVPVALVPSQVEYVAVEGREVVGIKPEGEYYPRDGVMADHYEPFFEWLESEVLV